MHHLVWLAPDQKLMGVPSVAGFAFPRRRHGHHYSESVRSEASYQPRQSFAPPPGSGKLASMRAELQKKIDRLEEDMHTHERVPSPSPADARRRERDLPPRPRPGARTEKAPPLVARPSPSCPSPGIRTTARIDSHGACDLANGKRVNADSSAAETVQAVLLCRAFIIPLQDQP